MQKIICPRCHKVMGGSSSTSKNKVKHIYYKCASCNTRINEKKVEKEITKFLNDMLDFFLIIDNSFKPTLNKDTEDTIKKYEKLKLEISDKIARIKKAFIDGIIEADTLKLELKSLENEFNSIITKLEDLETKKKSIDHKQDIETIFNLKEIEKSKQKAEYVKKHNLWKKLTQEQKQYIINKYIDEIQLEIDQDYNVSILNIIFNKNEIENIGYMFRNDCFDMIVNANDRDVILSNHKNKVEIDNYVKVLRNFYNIKETTSENELFDIKSLERDNIIQIIPQEKTQNLKRINIQFYKLGYENTSIFLFRGCDMENYFFKFLLPQLLEYFSNDTSVLDLFIPKIIENNFKNENSENNLKK